MAKKHSTTPATLGPPRLSIPCKMLEQGKHKMYLFPISAKTLWGVVQINQRQEDKEVGYQRALSGSRVNKIAAYLDEGNAIPGAILISFDKAKLGAGGERIRNRSEITSRYRNGLL